MSTEFKSRRSRIVAAVMTSVLLVAVAIAFLAANFINRSTVVTSDMITPMDSTDGETSLAKSIIPEDLTWTTSKLQRGETLSTYLRRMDVPDSLHYPIIQAVATQIDPRRMPAGAKIELGWSLEGLLRIDFSHPARDGVIQTTSVGNDQYVAEYVIVPADTVLAYHDGIVISSVYETLIENGGTPQLAVLFFEVFQFTHYFAVDTRRGDRFSFVVEEIWRDGEKTGYGSILAARYSGEFDTLTAVLKTDGVGAGEHFDDKGYTFRRDLLRVPFSAARITSTYGVRRHPVSGQVRMHHGVDLAADRGTPVVASGRGVVTTAEWNHPGYGNWVHIKHGDSGFETRYGHFQKIARGIREGVHVEQGDVIGYVGSTGNTTGPHLHYEVFRDGQRMNPLKVKGSPVQRIEDEELTTFIETSYRPWSYLLDVGESGWRLDIAATFGPLPVLLSSAFASR